MHLAACARRRTGNGVAEIAVIPRFPAAVLDVRPPGAEAPRVRALRMVGHFPTQAIDANFRGYLPRQVHLLVAVVPLEQDVAPVQERQVATGLPLLVDHRPQVGNRDVETAALTVLGVARRR